MTKYLFPKRQGPFFRAAKGLQYKLRRSQKEASYNREYPYYHKCVFIHIPRTGGVSLCSALFGNLGGGHMTYWEYEQLLKTNMMKFSVVSIVRNPWSRLFSAFHFLKNGGFNERDKNWATHNMIRYENFEQFVLEWLTDKHIWDYIHFHPQWHFLDGANLDYLGRFEDLPSAQSEIIKRVRHPYSNKVLKLNDTGEMYDYKKSYSKEMILKVNEVYYKDIELLDYKYSAE